MILCSYILQRNSKWIIVGYLLITSSALFPGNLFLQSVGTGTALFEIKSPKFILFFRFLAHHVLVNKEWKEEEKKGAGAI